jgi:hypothetical protein
MTEARFYARSASDRTDDWHWWFVADRAHGSLNVTGKLLERAGIDTKGWPLYPRGLCEAIAEVMNKSAKQRERT